MNARIHVCMYVRTYVRIRLCTYTCTYVCMYACMQSVGTYVRACMHVYMYVCVCVGLCVCVIRHGHRLFMSPCLFDPQFFAAMLFLIHVIIEYAPSHTIQYLHYIQTHAKTKSRLNCHQIIYRALPETNNSLTYHGNTKKVKLNFF